MNPATLLHAASAGLLIFTFTFTAGGAETAPWASHPPMRPLPSASKRVLPGYAVKFVDAGNGSDTHDGSFDQPWKTIAHATSRLQPGETLSLRGGTYYEPLTLKLQGASDKPVTLRSHPGELAVIDAGHRDFFESPATAWEPVPDGAPGEYRSTKTYMQGGRCGNFGDSMVPLHQYLTLEDLRSTNEFWRPGLGDRARDPEGIYCGPGTRRDEATGRIHIRLAHTQLPGLGVNAYRGETDPRKLPLVVTGADYGLRLEKCSHVRLQDLVIRGAGRGAVMVEASEGIVLDGVTLYGGQMALRTGRAKSVRVVDSAFRGHAAPWHSRAHHKYRASAGYLIALGGGDYEFIRCEFTDHHDFIALAEADNARIQGCFIENFNDDGIEPGPKRARGQFFIHENYLSRCLSPFTAHGKTPKPVDAEPGSGVYIYRNLIDLRRGTYRAIPETQAAAANSSFLDSPTEIIAHDHGGPVHPTYYVYQNTFLMGDGAWRGYYDFTWGAHMRGGAVRRVFNNIFVQNRGLPGMNVTMVAATDDYQSDGNLKWSLRDGPAFTGDFFLKFRQSPLFVESQKTYPPGWGAHDLFKDPRLVTLDADASKPLDARLRPDSPAIEAGVGLPDFLPDPLRNKDKTAPDIGALPLNAEPLRVGVRSRIIAGSAFP